MLNLARRKQMESIMRPRAHIVHTSGTHRASTPLSRHNTSFTDIVQELCESRGGRPGLSVLTSLLVSVDVKIY